MNTQHSIPVTCDPLPPTSADDVLAFWLSAMLRQPCSAKRVKALREALHDYGFNIVAVDDVAQQRNHIPERPA